ncbi:OprD family outer membrane porin [Acidithiobacillus sulfuriphilus]|uniref:OprD family outer membrane porin n=1 Tax=Acidithiobacillus sulfuriphilus TaxID=1867749 RepID=UPI003F60BB10
MPIHHHLIATAIALVYVGSAAQAETLTEFFQQSKIDGNIRSYYFSRLYGNPAVPNQNAYALAGRLNVETAPFLGGFGVGVSFFTAHSFGANDLSGATSPDSFGALTNYPHLDATLIGPNNSINALGQAYIQYQQPWLLVRAGDQEINTPWLNNTDSRILPATYQAVYAEVTPLKDLHFYGLREFRWKSRTSTDYSRDNYYYQPGFEADTLYGSTEGVLSKSAGQGTNGTLAFGASYALAGAKAQAWYYNFYNFANMFYGDASYTLKTGTGFDPFIGAQFVREWLGNNAFSQSRVGLNYPTSPNQGNYAVDSTAYGVQIGINTPSFGRVFNNGQLFWAYNALDPHAGTLGGGAIISPYTVGVVWDPLYTSSMIRGLVETGPGHAWKVKWTQNLFNKHILFMASFARYYTYFSGVSNDTYMDLTYFPGGDLKGLSIRDRVEVSNASPQNPGPGGSNYSFIYNRVQLQYDF